MKGQGTIQLKGRKQKGKGLILIISLFAGIMLFVCLLRIERATLADYQTKKVLVAVKDIPAKTSIEKEKLTDYFKEIEINRTYAVEGFTSLNQLSDFVKKQGAIMAVTDIRACEQIYKEKFISMESCIVNLEHPVEVGVKVNSYEYSVGGTLRAGDFIDISVVNLENEAKTLLEDVLVVRAFDSNGAEIGAEEKDRVSVGFNVLIEKEKLESYNAAIENGIIRLTKKFGRHQEQE